MKISARIKSLFVLIIVIAIYSQLSGQSPKREMRSVWLTTVWNLDWPSTTVPKATGTNDVARNNAILAQKNQLKAILDSLQRCNMQTVFFQIRSMSDAMYASSYEPWSRFVSSERGADPGYDPLEFAINEAHARGMELHAWLNPYRYSSSLTTYGSGANDYSSQHPDWLLDYGSYAMILNPGLPQVKQRIKDIVGEVVSKYDVDGIVFDDYFYAYGGTSSTLDASTQALYKPASMSVGDWRRRNVNQMIKGVYDTIQALKPYVTFGVSPFGTWTTDENVATARGLTLPSGVGKTGDMYYEIYCDPIAWLEEGSVDYISPQLYWTTNSSYPYGILANWWSGIANRYGKHFYSSQSLSAMTAASSVSPASSIIIQGEEVSLKGISTLERNLIVQKTETSLMRAASAFAPNEIGLQIDYNRQYDINDAPGSVFYSNNKILSTTGFIDYLRSNKFTSEALCPAISWKKSSEQTLVSNLSLQGASLSWNYTTAGARYAIYAVPLSEAGNSSVYASSLYLQGVSYQKQFTLPNSVSATTHQIGVAVLDRYGNEFPVRELNKGEVSSTPPTIVSPINGNLALLPSFFKWNAVPDAYSYVIQIAKDSNFENLIFSKESPTNQVLCRLQQSMVDGTYYWRVKALVANATSSWSSTATFASKAFAVTAPANGQTDISLTPDIEWDHVGESATYTVQISKSSAFNSADIVYQASVQGVSKISVPTGYLVSETNYYVRVLLSNDGTETISSANSFTTLALEIPVPTTISPVTGASLDGTSLTLTWQQQPSKGFRAELSTSSSFPSRGTTVKSVDAYTFSATFDGLSGQIYYLRVKALNSAGYTEPSEVVQVTLSGTTSISESESSGLSAYINPNGQLVINSDFPLSAGISLVSITGNVLFSESVNLVDGQNRLDLPKSNIPHGGIYLVRISTSKGNIILKYRN